MPRVVCNHRPCTRGNRQFKKVVVLWIGQMRTPKEVNLLMPGACAKAIKDLFDIDISKAEFVLPSSEEFFVLEQEWY